MSLLKKKIKVVFFSLKGRACLFIYKFCLYGYTSDRSHHSTTIDYFLTLFMEKLVVNIIFGSKRFVC